MAESMPETILEKVRRFAGADPTAADTVLEMCYRAAVEWYEGAGCPQNPESDQWTFWVCNLAAWMYDNRGNADANAVIPPYIVTSVHQLRKAVTPPESSTDATETTAGGW